MYSSLLLLSKIQLRSQWRKTKRALATPGGFLAALFMAGFLGILLVPRLMVGNAPREALGSISSLFFRPSFLFLLWLSTLLGSRFKSPIAFSMAEVEFLFAGPFTRRQLLIHKLSISTLGPLGFACLAPLMFPFVWWPAAFVGVLLTAAFLQWWTILLALAIGWIGARYRWLRWAVLVAAGVVAIFSIWQSDALSLDMQMDERFLALESTWTSRIVLAPFVVFSRTITAVSLGLMLAWGAASLVMVVAVAIAILNLDAHFVEASLEASRTRYESLKRLQRTGGASSFRLPSSPRFTLPGLPRWFGAGPIAWRQGIDSMRSSGGPVWMAIVPAAIGVATGVIATFVVPDGVPAVALMIGVTLAVGMMVTMSMPLALRADLEHVEALKPLPIGAGPIACGSVAAGVVYVTTLQLITATSIAITLGEWLPAVPVTIAVTLPVNLLWVAFDSVLVTLFPSIRHLTPGDPLVGIRIVMMSLAKMAFVFVAGGLAGVPVLAVWLILGNAVPALVATGYIVLLGEGLATVWIVAQLFAGFDVSAHANEEA